MTLSRAVIATDFSDRSSHAARWAVNHFARDLEVVLVHVVALPQPPRFLRARFPQSDSVAQSARLGAMSRLREFARALGAPQARLEVRIGHPAEELAAIAREVDADVLIVGRHGDRPGILHRLGTTADRLVKISPVPLLLATGIRDITPRRLLVALDDAAITPNVAAWTRLLAQRFGAEVVALHVVPSALLSHIISGACGEKEANAPSHETIRTRVADEADRWMRGLFEGDALPHFSIDVAFGSVAREIVGAAERHGSEVIVLGRTGAGLGRRLMVGSVAYLVLHTAHCPVFVVGESGEAVPAHDAA